MSRKWIFPLLVIFLFSFVFGVRSVEPENKPWIGSWDILWDLSDRSMMDKVIFKKEDGILHGDTEWGSRFIIGFSDGEVLRGTWARGPLFVYPDHGDIELSVSKKGNTFTGRWRIGTEEDKLGGLDIGDWSDIKGTKKGVKIEPPPAKLKTILTFKVNASPFEQEEAPVAVRIWDWTNRNVLATYEGSVARTIKIR